MVHSSKRFYTFRFLTHYRPTMPFGNRKIYFRGDLFSSALSQFEKYHPSGNMYFHNLGIFQSFKLCILVGKVLPISLKLNFISNTLGCYGLTYGDKTGGAILFVSPHISSVNLKVGIVHPL